jgi:hypothetical protein
VVLALFVVAWLFSTTLRAVPFWVPFIVALGLELQFFLAGREGRRPAPPDRLPQRADRERYGYGGDAGELLLVRDEDDELWVPYRGEEPEDLAELIEQERDDAERRRLAAARRSSERRPVRRLATAVAVVAALAALVWFVERRSGWDAVDADARAAAAQRFSAEASRIVGRPVTIRCDEAGERVGPVQHADGVAEVGGSLAYLTPERCHDLYRLAFRDEVRFSQTARSLAVLAHEAWHLRGVRDEGVTECYAYQSGVELGRRLGLSTGEARRMMRHELAENATRAGGTAAYRVPVECRDGGELDLAPGSDSFP